MSGDVWSGPLAVAAGLLVVAGVAKVIRPADTARALDTAGLPLGPLGVRLAALAEVGLGGWALVADGRPAAAGVALSYLAFVAFLVVAFRRRLPVSSCGCFGVPDTPPTPAHLLVDLGAAGAAVGALAADAPSLGTVVADQPLAGVPFVALVALGVVLAVVALTLLPRLAAAR